MSGKGFLAMAMAMATVVFGLIGCAEPKYETVQQTPSGNTSQSQKVTDCEIRFQASGHCLLWQWENLPTSTQVGSIIFKVVRSNALDDSPIPVDLNSVPTLVLWMPSMGHGSSPTTVEQVDTGSYRAKNVFFIMPGEWEMRFQVKDGSTVQDEALVTLTF